MNGMVYEFRWKYRRFDDELIVMDADQVFKLMVVPDLGRPADVNSVTNIAKATIIENIETLRSSNKLHAA